MFRLVAVLSSSSFQWRMGSRPEGTQRTQCQTNTLTLSIPAGSMVQDICIASYTAVFVPLLK